MTTSGHEEEFRRLFAREADQRLARLSQELLSLEEVGSDDELVASIFRDAHTLKGAAAVVGFDAVARVAHAMEDVLEELRSGTRQATSELIDALLATVDGLSVMIPAAVDGDDCWPDAERLVERLAVAGGPPGGDVATAAVAGEAVGSAGGVASEVPPSRTAVIDEPRRRSEVETVMVPVSRLDELVGLVGESAAAHLRIGRMLAERLSVDPGTVAEFHDLSRVLNDLQERTMRTRMVPVTTITDSLQRGVRDLARSLGKNVRWEVRGGDTELDRGMLQQLADPLLHLVRNAVDHGIEQPAERAAAGKPEQATVVLHAMQLGSEVTITVTDDGRGIDVDRVREQAVERGDDVSSMSDEESLYFIFRSGLSTAPVISDVSGRGVGLDVVRSSMDAVRGRIEVRSQPGLGSEFRIVVPITLAVLKCLLVAAGTERYAIPMHSVVVAEAASSEASAHAEGRAMVWAGGEAIMVSALSSTLGVNGSDDANLGHVIVLAGATRRHAFRVDRLIGQRDVVVKSLGRLLPRLAVLAGASVEPDGSILLVLDAAGIIDRARLSRTGEPLMGSFAEDVEARPSVKRRIDPGGRRRVDHS